MEHKKLGVLLSTGPSHPSAKTVAKLCAEVRHQHHEVYLYLIDEGVKNSHDPQFPFFVIKKC